MAKDVTLLIKLQDQASPKLNKLTQSTKRLEKAANGAQNSIRRTNKGIRDTGRVADKASKGVNNLGKAVRGLVAGFGLFQAGKFVIFKTAELERQTKSLEVLTGSLGNARSIIKELQQFGAVTPFTSAELIETAKRLKAFGFETEQIVDVTKRLADVAGATGADLGGIATAFGQIQAKGRLQGEELLQLQERGIGLQDELQKMYGMTGEEFRKALEGGRISAEAVNVALQNITNTGGKYANGAIAQSETLSGKFSTLVDNITVLAQNIGKVLAPVLKEILSIANNALSSINRLFTSEISRELSLGRLNLLTPGGTLGDVQGLTQSVSRINVGTISDEGSIVALSNELKTLQRQAEEVGTSINRSRAFKITDQEKQAFEGLQRVIQRQIELLGKRQKLLQQTTKPDTSPITVPELLKRTSGDPKISTKKTPEEIAAENLKKQKATAQSLLLTKKQDALLLTATTEQERESLQLAIEKFNLNRQFPDLSEEELQTLRDQLQTNFDLTKQQRERLKNAEALTKQQEIINGLFEQAGQTISTAIVDSLTQAKSVAEALSGALQNIGRQLVQLGVNSLLKSIGGPLFSALPGFANGGRPPVGRPSVVGERGPELFVPDRAGTILPNGVGMGSTTITVNVSASETSADASNGQGASLGKAIGLAVQLELIKQKRPGGLLATV